MADIADSPLASIHPDFGSAIDRPIEEIAEMFDVDLATASKIDAWHRERSREDLRRHESDLLSIVVGGLLSSQNIKIASAGLAFATNMAATNGLGSQAEYARSIGVSRTILSKAVKAWQRQFHLHTSPHQKTESACATYSHVGKEKHWRKTKATATELARRLNTILRKKA